jgi:hypothetical protein
VPARGWLKTRLSEPPTRAQEADKQILLWAGLVVLIYGFAVLFGGRVRPVYCCGYFNFWWGVWVSALAFAMLVPLRVRTLREEFRGTVKIMTAGMADFPDSQREQMLARRLTTVAALGERERTIHLGLVIATVEAQSRGRKQAIQRSRQAVLESAPPGIREKLDRTSRLLAGGRCGPRRPRTRRPASHEITASSRPNAGGCWGGNGPYLTFQRLELLWSGTERDDAPARRDGR